MADDKIYDEPSEVSVEDSAVSMKGPGPINVKLTPGAAEETSNRLLDGSMKARGEEYFNRRKPK